MHEERAGGTTPRLLLKRRVGVATRRAEPTREVGGGRWHFDLVPADVEEKRLAMMVEERPPSFLRPDDRVSACDPRRNRACVWSTTRRFERMTRPELRREGREPAIDRVVGQIQRADHLASTREQERWDRAGIRRRSERGIVEHARRVGTFRERRCERNPCFSPRSARETPPSTSGMA